VYADGKRTSGSSFTYMNELISRIHEVLSWERNEIFIELLVRKNTLHNFCLVFQQSLFDFLRQVYCNFMLICLSNHQYIS
jgi:hypothetical protein